jgi:hypothetical protein
MRIRRRLPILFGVLAVAAAVALVVVLRKNAPPEPARLLPGADAFFYFNLQWARRVGALEQLPPVSHDPEYERFIQETDFQFERDLEQAAFAVHYPPSVTGGTPASRSAELRFSEVFVAKVHGDRLVNYLRKMARSVENYHSVDIFSIPLEGRTLRVAVLGVNIVAASNHDDPEVIRGIIDRSRKLASPFGGPAFLRQYYKYVPLASLAWAVVRADPANDKTAGGLQWTSFLFPKSSVVVASARYIRALHLRAEAFTASEADATRITEQLQAFLNIFRSATNSASNHGTDADVKAFLDSLTIQQQGKRAILTATASSAFLHKALTTPPAELAPAPPPEPQQKAEPPSKPKGQHN